MLWSKTVITMIFFLLFPHFCVLSHELYILWLLSSANQLRRGKVENVCRSEKETPALLLEGQRVPRAAGKTKYIWDVTHCSAVFSNPLTHLDIWMFSFCLSGGLWCSRYSKVHGLVWKLHMCWFQTRLLPNSGMCYMKHQAFYTHLYLFVANLQFKVIPHP